MNANTPQLDGVKQHGRLNDNHLGRPDKMIVAAQRAAGTNPDITIVIEIQIVNTGRLLERGEQQLR